MSMPWTKDVHHLSTFTVLALVRTVSNVEFVYISRRVGGADMKR